MFPSLRAFIETLDGVTSGEFTYLTAEPGQDVRLRKVDDKIEYVEHVDKAWESVTWWGELRVVLKK